MMSLLNRCVILIDNDNALPAVVLMQKQRQKLQAHLTINFICMIAGNAMILLFFICGQHGTVFQLIVPHKFQRDQDTNFLESLFPSQAFHILKRQKDYRVLSLMAGIKISTLPYLLIFKINGCVFLYFFKENAEHIHIQGFAKTPWTSKQRYHRFDIKKVADQQSFVYIIIAYSHSLKIRPPWAKASFSHLTRQKQHPHKTNIP